MKWDKYYHLPEIEEIRQKILDTYTNKLVFLEEPHEYYLDGVQYMCVSDVTHKYKPKSSEQMAEGCVAKWKREQDPSYKYYGMSKEEILALWSKISGEACEFGTNVHAFGESMFYFMTEQYGKILPECKSQFEKGYPVPLNPHEEAVVKFWDEIPDNFVPVLAETKVFNRNGTPYAGTFDILFYYVDEPDSEKNGLCVWDYKGLDIKTPILTTNGWKTMETIQEGDCVYDEDGNETKVLHASEIHYKDCYKIVFDNNAEIVADEEHRWKISFWRDKGIFSEKIMTTKEVFEQFEKNKGTKNTRNFPRIKVSNGIQGKAENLLIDPYVLGVWLGDGHSSCGMITNMYDEIFDEIHNRGFEIGSDVSQGGAGKAKSRTIYGLRTLLNKYNLINNKHIPHEYLCSDFETKIDLLRGIMDTDGYYNKARKRFILSTTRLSQVDFCKSLLSSLGIKSTVIACQKTCNGKKITGYDVSFYSDFYPFLIRKMDIEKPKTDKRTTLLIKNVEKVDTIPTRCIEVDSPKHTFLFGKDMIVTHNTNKDLFNNFRGQTLLWPFNDLLDQNESYYTLQLGLYSIPLENLGYKVVARRLIWLRPDGTYEKIRIPLITDRLRDALDIPSAKEIIDKKLL